MNSFYLYKADINNLNRNIMICYISGFGFDFIKFSDTIKNAFQDSPFSKQLVIISADYNREEIESKLTSDSKYIKKLKEKINNYQVLNIHTGFIKVDGCVIFNNILDPNNDSIFSIEAHFKQLMEKGITTIIEKRNLVMESSANYHFVKPSGKHTNRFIKASNVMENGAEISFLAINLIKYTSGEIDKIYTDTAGIFPLAYELISIISRFKKYDTCGSIDTFGSYKGIDSYIFSDGKQSLVLISASTSNDLSNKLKLKTGLSQAKIITLFSSNPHAEESSTLVCFKKYFEKYRNPLFSDFKSSDGHECNLCIYEKSIPLSLSNSQFVFEAPKTELYLPLAKDSDKNLRDLISNYKDSKVFKCLYDGLDGKTTPTPEYFIDVSELVKNNNSYKEKIDNSVIRNFPLSADLIVHANDQGALDVSKYIKKKVYGLRKIVKLTSIECIEKSPPKKGIIVVAGSIQTGKSLLDISRKLRKYNALPITYIVGFAKYNDPESYAKLKRDLAFNNGNPKLGNHQFIAIDEIMLPINEHRKNSWERELEALKTIKNLSANTAKSTKAVEDRESALRKATDEEKKGIGENIFLTRPNGNNMTLGPTFAFWSEEDNKETFTHQATVYFTISTILQNLRYQKTGRITTPLGEGYVVKQLDPLIFDRFNEGVIQASILRSAKPRELDFSADDTSSRIVGSLILKMIDEPTHDTSEALPEFLLALCTEKLQIKKDHIKEMLDKTVCKDNFPMSWILLEHTKSIIFNLELNSGTEGIGNVPF